MKKIIQLALLITAISTTTSYCWQWSDIVPNRLQNWYQDWQIRREQAKIEKMRYYARFQIRQQQAELQKKYGFEPLIPETESLKQDNLKDQTALKNYRFETSRNLSNWYQNFQVRQQKSKAETARNLSNWYQKWQTKQ